MSDIFTHPLPRMCAARLRGEDTNIIIVHGESGYHPAEYIEDPDAWNKDQGITPRMVAAMELGSMFGWDVPGADPFNAMYDRLPESF